MKIVSIKLVCLVMSLALSAACASYSIGGINLKTLDKIPVGEGPADSGLQINAYVQPLGNKHYASLDSWWKFKSPQEPMPRTHLFFALQKIVAGLDAAGISLAEPVHIQAAAGKIELTFRKESGESLTVKLPPNPNEAFWLGSHGEQTVYWPKGKLLILHDSTAMWPEAFDNYSSAIVFHMRDDELAVYTREYRKHYNGFMPFIPPSTDIQQEGYVYKMLDVLESPKASEASGADL